jgi:hypothetical protein
MKRFWMFLVLLLALAFIALPFFISAWQKRMAVSTTTAPVTRYGETSSVANPAVRTIEDTTIIYWLYGRFVAWGEETHDGQFATFVIDGDPFRTKLNIRLQNHDGLYKVRWYDDSFGPKFGQQLMDGRSLQLLLSNYTSPVELRVGFLRSQVSAESQRIMTALESANTGNWQNLPQDLLISDSVGVVHAKVIPSPVP